MQFLYLDEITAAAQTHPGLRPHLADSSVDGYLTADQAIADLADPPPPRCTCAGRRP